MKGLNSKFYNKYFCLFGDCYPVSDSKRCAVYLLNSNRIEILPLDAFGLLHLLKNDTIGSVASNYHNSEVIYNWVAYFLKIGIGFLTSDISGFCYPKILPQFSPSHIKRLQLEYSSTSNYNLSEVAKAIEELHCKHAEIRFLGNDITNEFVSFFLNFFRVSCLRSIILYIDGKHFRVKDATQITETNKKVNKIIICNTQELSFADDVLTTQGTLQYFSQKKWPIDRLIINRAMFAEAFHYNTFYNNKMAIDKIGFIRNDLYLPETYGKFDKCIDICQIVHSSSFRRFWKISPDQIEELKDNALRYAIYPAREIIMSEEKFHIKI